MANVSMSGAGIIFNGSTEAQKQSQFDGDANRRLDNRLADAIAR